MNRHNHICGWSFNYNIHWYQKDLSLSWHNGKSHDIIMRHHMTSHDIIDRVSEYIPQRPALPRKVGGAARALGEFHSQTISIITALLQEYREMFMTENKTESNIDDRLAVIEVVLYIYSLLHLTPTPPPPPLSASPLSLTT